MKYPRIAHVPFSSVYDPTDLIRRTRSAIFGMEWVVTEKLDGSQVNIQFVDGMIEVWNRNTDVLHGGADRQFNMIHQWLQSRHEALWNLLGDDRIVFGDWMFHVHTLKYTRLPDVFVSYDIYNKPSGAFVPFDDAMTEIEKAGLFHVPVIAKVVLRDEAHLLSFVSTSAYSDCEMEGLVLHSADGKDRVKYVTPGFKVAIDARGAHWRECDRTRNVIAGCEARPA